MSATIFTITEKFPTPELDFANFDHAKYNKDNDDYIAKVKKFLLSQKSGKNIGEILNFPVADGSAQYMVASMRPLQLVHLELGDAYHFQYDYLLTAKEVNQKLESQRAMDKLFSRG